MKKVLSLVMVFMVAFMWATPGFSGNAYMSGNLGLTWMDDVEFTSNWTDDTEGFDLGTDSGVALSGAVGYDFGDYRAELELGYQSNDVDSWADSDDGYVSDAEEASGEVSVISVMANGAYDIDLGGVELSPFVGAGFAFISFDDAPVCFSGSEYRSKSATTFAYQIGASLALPVADTIMLEGRYRYLGTADFNFDRPEAEADFASHSALVGLRFSL